MLYLELPSSDFYEEHFWVNFNSNPFEHYVYTKYNEEKEEKLVSYEGAYQLCCSHNGEEYILEDFYPFGNRKFMLVIFKSEKERKLYLVFDIRSSFLYAFWYDGKFYVKEGLYYAFVRKIRRQIRYWRKEENSVRNIDYELHRAFKFYIKEAY